MSAPALRPAGHDPASRRPPPPARPGGGVWSPAQRATTLGLVLTVTLVACEALAVITILPVVSADLGGVGLYGWVISAFSLGTIFGIVVAGDLTDRHGPAGPFAAGLLLFALGLLLGGLAPTMLVLVLARGLQGVGAGAIPSVAYASIGRTYGEAARPRVFAILSTAWVVPGLLGPSAAAVVAIHLGWRWVFFGLIPLVVVAGTLTALPLRRLQPSADTPASPARIRDALLVSVGTGLLLGGLGTGSVALLTPLAAAGLLCAGPALLRLLPAGTLRGRPGLPAAVLARGLLTFAFFGADTFVPLSLTAARGQSATVAGAAVTAATLAWSAGSWAQARQAPVWSARRLVGTGFALVVTGIAITALVLVPALPVPLAVAGWAVAGLGMGFAYGTLSLTVLREARPGLEGSAAAALQLSDLLGVGVGAGLGGAVVAVTGHAGRASTGGMATAFAVAGAVGVAGLVAARRLPATAVG